MSEVEKAAIFLRRQLSDKELAGEMTESNALRLIEALQEIETILKD